MGLLLFFIRKYYNIIYITLLFTIYITGQLNLTLDENRITHDIIGHVENDTWTVKHHRVIMTVGRMKLHISGFFDDSKELSKY